MIGLLAIAAISMAQSRVDSDSGQGTAQLFNSVHQGLWPFLLLSFTGGLLALLTPCVFPMVPVTVSFFSKRTHRPALSALIYAFGIIATFSIVGVGSAAIFGASQVSRFATNPWVNVVLALIFVLLALNLFGLYEFRIGFASKISSEATKKKDSLISPLLMGTAFSLTSFTCTGPIVAGLLLISAKGGGLTYPILGMTSFGIAFSLPFFILAMFPAAMAKMPRSGAWIGAVKPALGFIELAAALKFLSNADLVWQLGLLKRPVFVAIWGLLALGLAAYLFGLPKGFSKTGWIRRGLAAGALIVGIVMLANPQSPGLDNIDAFLPPSPYPSIVPSTVPSGAKIAQEIYPNYEQALKVAGEMHMNLFVDFTGVTCTNCRWMEDNVFPKKSVQKYLQTMVRAELYTDRGTTSDNHNQDLQQKLGNTIALPLYLVVSPEGKVLDSYEGASRNPQDFVNFLKKATNS